MWKRLRPCRPLCSSFSSGGHHHFHNHRTLFSSCYNHHHCFPDHQPLIFAVAQGTTQDFPLPVLPPSSTPLFQVRISAEMRFIFDANFWKNWFTRILQEWSSALVHIVEKPLFKEGFLIYLIVYKCRK